MNYLMKENGIDVNVNDTPTQQAVTAQSDIPDLQQVATEATCESNSDLIQISTNSNGPYSGDLLQQGVLSDTHNQLFTSNKFLKVTTHSLVAGGDHNILRHNDMVSTSSIVNYTSTTPTVTNQIAAISPSNVHLGEQTSFAHLVPTLPLSCQLDPGSIHLVENVPSVSEIHQVDTHTTATLVTYVLAMSVEDDTPTVQKMTTSNEDESLQFKNHNEHRHQN